MAPTPPVEPAVLLALAETLDEGLVPRGETLWPEALLETPFGPVRVRVEGARTLTLHTMNEQRGHDPIFVNRVKVHLNVDATCHPGGAWSIPYSRYGIRRADGAEVSESARAKLQSTLASLVQDWARASETLLRDGELARLSDAARKHEEQAKKRLREPLASLRQLVTADIALNAQRAAVPHKEA